MKTWLWAGLMAAVLAVSVAPATSEAKRLGGGKSLGMQRSSPPPSAAPNAVPAKPAAAPAAAVPPAAAAVPPKRNWMGPLAGLAAGLGIGALLSHFGMGGLGEGMGSLLSMLLIAGVAFFVIRFLMQRFGRGNGGGLQMAGAGNTAGMFPGNTGGGNNAWAANGSNAATTMQRVAEPAWGNPASAAGAAAAAATAPALASGYAPASPVPAGFDTEGFVHIAKMIFIRLQAANDKADLNDLRNFTTPEMFAAIRLDLQERGPTSQQTDVVKVDAQVIEVAQEADRQLVSVRFSGLIREDLGGAATDFDEVWHLAKPNGDGGAWAIAGIQQRQ